MHQSPDTATAGSGKRITTAANAGGIKTAVQYCLELQYLFFRDWGWPGPYRILQDLVVVKSPHESSAPALGTFLEILDVRWDVELMSADAASNKLFGHVHASGSVPLDRRIDVNTPIRYYSVARKTG